MSTFALLRPALVALAIQIVTGVLVLLGANATYGPHPSLEWAPLPGALLAALVLGGVVAGGLALRGLFRLHLHRGAAPALLWTGIAYLPVLLVASLETVILLVLLRAW